MLKRKDVELLAEGITKGPDRIDRDCSDRSKLDEDDRLRI
jgi:hypothetical protein